MAIAITLNNATIGADAPSGAVIGTFNTDGLRFQANGNPYGYFLLVGRMLVVTWDGQAMPGVYTVQVHAPGGPPASFAITITAPSAVVPVSLVLTPASITLPDNSPVGTKVCSAVVTMSDGSAFAGVTSTSSGLIIFGPNVTLSRTLTSADDGVHSFTITATQNSVTVSAVLTLTVGAVTVPTLTVTPVTVAPGAIVTATLANGPANIKDWLGVFAVGAPSDSAHAGSWKWLASDLNTSVLPTAGVAGGTVHLAMPTAPGQYEVRFFPNDGWVATATSPTVTVQPSTALPTTVTLTPSSVSLPDNSPAGTLLATVRVAMSDGSAFAGILVTSNSLVAVAPNGSSLVLVRALTATDDGLHTFTVSATQNAITAVATFALTVAAPSAIIAVTPTAPLIPDTAPLGSTVANYSVTMSDGTPFIGTVGFGPPNFDNAGVFALVASSKSSGQIIVNPAGPGVGPNATQVTDHVTLLATT